MKSPAALLSLLFLLQQSLTVVTFQLLAPQQRLARVSSLRCPKPSSFSRRIGAHATGSPVSIHSEVDPVIRKRRLALWMAFFTGMADVALSLQFQTFATMLTGNLMWLSRAVVEQNVSTVFYYISVVCSYMTGLSISRCLRNQPPTTILRTVGAGVMALFAGADWLFYGLGVSRWIPVCMLALAYGAINSMGTDFAGTLTFVVTGHVTKLTHLATDVIVEDRPLTEADMVAAQQCVSVIGGFFVGALTSFYLLSKKLLLKRGFFSMLGVAYGVVFFSYDGRRIKRWWKRRRIPEMMIDPPKIEYVQANETAAIAEAVSEAISEDRDVVVVYANNATLPIAAKSENSTIPTMIIDS